MIKSNDFGFNHVFVNYSSSSFSTSSSNNFNNNNKQENEDTSKNLTFILLQGTGGNEEDLLFLGKELEPDAAILSPRGKVLENGMPRFFRRLSEGVFDIEDLKFRTYELGDLSKNVLHIINLI